MDGDGLIDISDATALSNIRHDLTGNSYKTGKDATGFTRGCPDSGCNGYELTE